MHRPKTSVLFVSRHNAARSLLAEACLRHLGHSRFKVNSCGVPALSDGYPSEWALLALKTAGMSSEGLRCKGWTEFARGGAPRLDIVIALDQETAYQQPRWPGQPDTAVWAFPLLVAQDRNGNDLGIATLKTLHALRRRIELLISLHARSVNPSDFRHDLRDMAHF
jgi:arsenate reductase